MIPDHQFPRPMTYRAWGWLLCLVATLIVPLQSGCSVSGESSEVVSEEDGRPVAEAFVELIRSGKASEAWDSTTAEFKSAEGKESFLRSLKGKTFLSDPLTFDSVQTADMNGKKRNEFRFKSKGGHEVVVVVGPENGEWKVDWLTIR